MVHSIPLSFILFITTQHVLVLQPHLLLTPLFAPLVLVHVPFFFIFNLVLTSAVKSVFFSPLLFASSFFFLFLPVLVSDMKFIIQFTLIGSYIGGLELHRRYRLKSQQKIFSQLPAAARA